MYGFDHIPLGQRAISVTEFSPMHDRANGLGVVQYSVPRGATFLYVFAVIGGGRGGTPVVGAGVSGGGGGGSGSVIKALIPTMLIPSTLYVRLDNESASGGGGFFLAIDRSTAFSQNLILFADGAGNGAAAGTAGPGGAAMTVANARLAGTCALWVSQAGAAGGAGSTTNGAAVTALGTLPLSGGGGGGGSSAGTGGNVTGAGPFPTITGGASGENPGRPGYMLRQPFGGVGGSGGGGVNAAGTGLNFGGDGAIGCGGGGGGNASSGTAGAGGKGGPGYCLIVAF